MHISHRAMRKIMVTACACGTAAAASAQSATSADVLQEVTVTATKTGNVSAQSAPFTIQAIGEDALTQGQMQGFDDYAKLVPGMASLNKGPDQTQIIIRGITAGRVSHAEPQNQSTSGLYIDEMPVADNAFNPDLDLFDVNRIEVLKGPQGTLYGAGAMSGAIRVITNEVDLTRFSGASSLSGAAVDHGDPDYAAHTMANVPLVEGQLGLRASAYYDHEGGYINNVYNGQTNYNDYSTSGGRLKGLWKPDDLTNVHLSVLYQKLVAEGRPQMFMPGDPAVTAVQGPTESFSVARDYETVKFVPDPFDDKFLLTNLLVDHDFGSVKLVSSTSYLNRIFDNQLDDTYRTRIHFGPVQADGVTPLATPMVNDSNVNDIAQELRLTQKLDSGLSWVGGLYYERHDIHFVQSGITPGLDALTISYGLPPAAGFGAQPNSEFDGNENDRQQQYAAFGELTIPLAARWDFIAGLRWFHYKQDSTLRYAGIANDGVTSKDSTTGQNGNTPKAQITYRPSQDATIYLQAAKGFRLGGITEPVPMAGVFGTDCGKDLAAVGLTSIPNSFQSDHLWSFELGGKTSWLDHRLTINASVFDIEWSNIQTNVFLPCSFIVVVNAGKVRSRGAEAEVSWAVGGGFTLSASAAYTDATLVDKTLQFTAQLGDRVPNVPKLNGDAVAEYRRPFGIQGRSMFVRTSVSYVGDSYTEFQSLGNAKLVPASASVDGSLGVDVNDWEVTVFGKNLANRLIVTGVDTDRLVPTTYSVAPPRTVGLEVRYRY
ncbi:MAG TPA: TonB-dependent receptor [Steroidobacteraceae bacterium]|nr:TonB-dependent receptor [Steroidobacteraceae bacterium]